MLLCIVQPFGSNCADRPPGYKEACARLLHFFASLKTCMGGRTSGFSTSSGGRGGKGGVGSRRGEGGPAPPEHLVDCLIRLGGVGEAQLTIRRHLLQQVDFIKPLRIAARADDA